MSCSLGSHGALAERSHSTGISFSFQLSDWNQTSALAVAPVALCSLPTRRKEIDFNEKPTCWTAPGQFEIHPTISPCPWGQSTSFLYQRLCPALICASPHRLKTQRHSHLPLPWNRRDRDDLGVLGCSPTSLCWWTGTSPGPWSHGAGWLLITKQTCWCFNLNPLTCWQAQCSRVSVTCVAY